METNNSQLVIYQAPDGNMSIDVTVQNDTVWLSQGQMAELFYKDQSVIARHISNVFKEGELEKFFIYDTCQFVHCINLLNCFYNRY